MSTETTWFGCCGCEWGCEFESTSNDEREQHEYECEFAAAFFQRSRIEQAVACPSCKVPVGAVCETNGKHRRDPHGRRVTAYLKWEQEQS